MIIKIGTIVLLNDSFLSLKKNVDDNHPFYKNYRDLISIIDYIPNIWNIKDINFYIDAKLISEVGQMNGIHYLISNENCLRCFWVNELYIYTLEERRDRIIDKIIKDGDK